MKVMNNGYLFKCIGYMIDIDRQYEIKLNVISLQVNKFNHILNTNSNYFVIYILFTYSYYLSLIHVHLFLCSPFNTSFN